MFRMIFVECIKTGASWLRWLMYGCSPVGQFTDASVVFMYWRDLSVRCGRLARTRPPLNPDYDAETRLAVVRYRRAD